MSNNRNSLEARERKHIKRFVIKAILFTICFLLADLLIPPIYMPDLNNPPFYVAHNTLGWTGVPNYEGVIEDTELKPLVTFNSLGMHDTEHSLAKPPHTFRILMLGDSFVQAIQVDESVTSHQVMENYLNQIGIALNYEVISIGMAGWGTAQELEYYREQGRNFQPDLVLLMLFFGNDFDNNLPGDALTINRFNSYAPYFVVCDGKLNPEPLTYAPSISTLKNDCSFFRRLLVNGMGKLYQNSLLYQKIERGIISKHPRQMFGENYPSPFWALYIPNDEPELEQAWQIMQGLIKQLQQEVEAAGSKFAVAFFPWRVIIELSLFTPAQQEALLKEYPAFAAVEINRPNQRMAEFLRQQNIPFIDLMPPMIEYQANHTTPLHFMGDSHWTVEGNRFVAETLADWLARSNLLPE